MRTVAASLLLLLSAAPTRAQEGPADLGELLRPLLAAHDVPALGCAVVVDGQLAGIGVAGVRRRGFDDEVTVHDRWHLGSCTKAMTATLLAKQVAAGDLSWTSTVADALPDLREGMHDDARGITLRHLLEHRAGLPGGPSRPLWLRLFDWSDGDREARTAVAKELLGAAPAAEPGARYLYSNAGYMIAGAIAERVGGAGRDWQRLMQEELFAPLGMRHAGFGPPGAEDEPDQPWGHRGPDGAPLYFDNPRSMGPAGTVHAPLADWARFVRLHLGVVDESAQPMLDQQRLAELHTPSEGAGYALGWNVTRRGWAPGPILNHAGSNTMWFCVAWLAPEIDFAVLVTCNQGAADAACDAVVAACIRRFRG